MDTQNPATDKIRCNTPTCGCQSLPDYLKTRGDRFIYVDNDKRFIWMDVPKCASTSLKDQLFPTIDAVHQGRAAIKHNIVSYFKFAFVRNPYDRMVSNYIMFTQQKHRIKQLESYDLPWLNHVQDFSFKEFLTVLTRIDNHHLNSQTNFIPFLPDFVGRFENLEEELSHVCTILGLPRGKPRHLNKTLHEPYTEYYDAESLAIVSKLYKLDIKRFGYKFAVPA